MKQHGGEIAPGYFERIIDRRSTESLKWDTYEKDVLPMWVADMDFPAPPCVIRALHERVNHGIFGYATRPQALVDVIVERLQRLYQWTVAADAVTFIPGVVAGFNLAIRVAARLGGEILFQTPVYAPIQKAAGNSGMNSRIQRLIYRPNHPYEIDMDSFAVSMNPQSRAFLLCNPHNPVGRVFRRDELSRMAEICIQHGVIIISDEIHCDLTFSGNNHVPIASLDPEIARHAITLMAPSKTFNIAGLECAMAIIPDPDLRRKFEEARCGMVTGSNILAIRAAMAAYCEGDPWLHELMRCLQSNRDCVQHFVADRLPGISMIRPEGTFLAWLDCSAAELPCKPAKFFHKHGRIALNEGKSFGAGGEGFVRLNFGCPRPMLIEGLERMASALATR